MIFFYVKVFLCNAEMDLNGNRRDYVIVVFWMLLRHVILGLSELGVVGAEVANGTDEIRLNNRWQLEYISLTRID